MYAPSNDRRPLQVPPSPYQKKRRRFPWWALLLIVLCLCSLAAAWVFADDQITQYEQFNDMRAVVSRDVFFGNITIDGTLIQGMTLEEARQALSGHKESTAQQFEVVLSAGDYRWRISSQEVPMQWDTESLLQKAYLIGRTGSLEQRYRQITSQMEPVTLNSTFTYDKAAVRTITDAAAAQLTRPATDASVVAFDVANRTFTFIDAKAGQAVDADALYQAAISALDGGQYGTQIAIDVQPVQPSVTRVDLETNYVRLASYTTKTTSDKNRNNNINLAAHALNGARIDPGETISFNETTGQRTTEKGYLEAGAIANGQSIQEVGGGVCQVSTTLFNALVRANCEIVNRKPHAWPSDYVPKGEDATVDWPNLDLVMRNTSDTPLFVTAWYGDQQVTVEVYGYSLGPGVSIELSSNTTYTKEPTEVVYTYNGNLPLGTTQKVRNPHTAYAVETYKIWLRDGVETSRELFYKSDYRLINEEYEYNDGNPPG